MEAFVVNTEGTKYTVKVQNAHTVEIDVEAGSEEEAKKKAIFQYQMKYIIRA